MKAPSITSPKKQIPSSKIRNAAIAVFTLFTVFTSLAAADFGETKKQLFRYKTKDAAISRVLNKKADAAELVVELIGNSDDFVNISDGFRTSCITLGKKANKRKEKTGEYCPCLDGYCLGVEILQKADPQLRRRSLLPALKKFYAETTDVDSRMNAHHAISLFDPKFSRSSEVKDSEVKSRSKGEFARVWKSILTPDHPRGYAEPYYDLNALEQGEGSIADLADAVRSHENGFVRYLGMIMGSLYKEKAVPTLLKLMKDEDWYPRWAATAALETMGAKAKAALPKLERRLADKAEDIEVRIGAARAIARIKSEDPFSIYRSIPDYEDLVIRSTREKVAAWKKYYIQKEAAKFPESPKYPNSPIKGRAVYAMLTNQHLDAVNEYIVEQCKKGIKDGTSWYPDQTMLELLMMFHSKSSVHPGRLAPEAEAILKEYAFKFSNAELKTSPHHHVTGEEAEVSLAAVKADPSLILPNNDNGYLKPLSFNYLACAALMEFPEYKNRKFGSGETVAQRYEIFTRFFKQSFKGWALSGLTPELGCGGYEVYTWACLLQLANLAPDPELRKLAKMYIDVALMEVEQISSNTVRAGYKSRPKTCWLGSRLRPVRAMFFGERGGSALYPSFVLGDYQAPEAAILLRKLGSPVRRFEIRNQYPGEAVDGATAYNAKKNHTALPRLFWKKNPPCVGYAWHTPEYVIGGMQFDPARDLWAGFASHWFGVLFNNLQTVSLGGYYGGQACLQDKNVLIFQRYSGSMWYGCPLIELSRGLEWEERDGWVFVNNDTAYTAIKVVSGGYLWDPDPTPLKRIWPNDPFSPVIVQTAEAGDYQSFQNFQYKILKARLRLEYTGGKNKVLKKITYAGPGNKELVMPLDTHHSQCRKHYDAVTTGAFKGAKIGGKPVDLNLNYTYSSPFMTQKVNDHKVRLQYGKRKWLYDFSKLLVVGE